MLHKLKITNCNFSLDQPISIGFSYFRRQTFLCHSIYQFDLQICVTQKSKKTRSKVIYKRFKIRFFFIRLNLSSTNYNVE